MAQSKQQKGTVSRVMHEFKKGELRTRGTGPKVKNRRQAIAIALHESGSTNTESPRKNKQNLSKTKAKERKGQTAEARKEGKAAQKRTMARATTRKSSRPTTTRKASAKKATSAARKTTERKTTARKTSARKMTARKTAVTGRAQAKTSASRNIARSGNQTKAMLYAEAKKRNIPGRSKMSKGQLERALR